MDEKAFIDNVILKAGNIGFAPNANTLRIGHEIIERMGGVVSLALSLPTKFRNKEPDVLTKDVNTIAAAFGFDKPSKEDMKRLLPENRLADSEDVIKAVIKLLQVPQKKIDEYLLLEPTKESRNKRDYELHDLKGFLIERFNDVTKAISKLHVETLRAGDKRRDWTPLFFNEYGENFREVLLQNPIWLAFSGEWAQYFRNIVRFSDVSPEQKKQFADIAFNRYNSKGGVRDVYENMDVKALVEIIGIIPEDQQVDLFHEMCGTFFDNYVYSGTGKIMDRMRKLAGLLQVHESICKPEFVKQVVDATNEYANSQTGAHARKEWPSITDIWCYKAGNRDEALLKSILLKNNDDLVKGEEDRFNMDDRNDCVNEILANDPTLALYSLLALSPSNRNSRQLLGESNEEKIDLIMQRFNLLKDNVEIDPELLSACVAVQMSLREGNFPYNTEISAFAEIFKNAGVLSCCDFDGVMGVIDAKLGREQGTTALSFLTRYTDTDAVAKDDPYKNRMISYAVPPEINISEWSKLYHRNYPQYDPNAEKPKRMLR